MQTAMLRLDRLLRRRRRLVLIGWAVILLAALPFAARQSEHLSSGGFGVPGSASAAVDEALTGFPGVPRAQLAAVLMPEPGATPAQLRAAVARVGDGVEPVAGVALPAATRAEADRRAAAGGTVVVPLRVAVDEDAATDLAVDLRENLGAGEGARDGVTTSLVGQGALWAAMQELSKEDLAKAETAGFPLVLIILLLVFGSLAAAALPLALGFVAVLVTGALIYVLSQSMEMSVFVTNMASMIGIGVAVDYSLFIVARYREEVAGGRSHEEARGVALATSGLAVLFSGLTVIVSLAGLWMVDNTAIRSMALGAILVVAVAMLAAVTLLPALISLLGHRVVRRSRLLRGRGSGTFWQGWTDGVMKRPVLAATVVTAVLLALAAPVLGLGTTTGALDQFGGDHEIRAGVAAAAQVAGPGASAPVEVVVAGPGAAQAGARVRAAAAADPGIARVAAPVPSRDGGAVLVSAQPRAEGETAAAKATVDRLRTALPAAAGEGVRVDVGGVTAVADRHRAADQRLDVEDPALPARAVLPRAARPAAQRRAAAQGGADEPAQRRRGVRGADAGLRRGRHPHAAARPGGRLRALDGLRGVPALADPRALRGDRRHAHRGRRGAGRERADDHLGGGDHGRRLRACSSRSACPRSSRSGSARRSRSRSTRRSSG